MRGSDPLLIWMMEDSPSGIFANLHVRPVSWSDIGPYNHGLLFSIWDFRSNLVMATQG